MSITPDLRREIRVLVKLQRRAAVGSAEIHRADADAYRLARLRDAAQYLLDAATAYDQAVDRGWLVAAAHRGMQLQYDIRRLKSAIEQAPQAPLCPRSIVAASLRDMLADVEALRREFPQVEFVCDRHSTGIKVTTDPIVLRDVALGQFEIFLVVPDQALVEGTGRGVYFQVDGGCRTFGRDHRHPHIDGVGLCEGAGTQAITAALGECRLLDFFLVVRSLLATYNPRSAYAKLDEPAYDDDDDDDDTTECEDCGCTVAYDESYSCDCCGCETCGDCNDRCDVCEDRGMCRGCRVDCNGEDCEIRMCPTCSAWCDRCNQHYCPECYSKEDNRCRECIEEAAELSRLREPREPAAEAAEAAAAAEEPRDDDQKEGASAAVHADGLGEAALPA